MKKNIKKLYTTNYTCIHFRCHAASSTYDAIGDPFSVVSSNISGGISVPHPPGTAREASASVCVIVTMTGIRNRSCTILAIATFGGVGCHNYIDCDCSSSGCGCWICCTLGLGSFGSTGKSSWSCSCSCCSSNQTCYGIGSSTETSGTDSTCSGCCSTGCWC